MPKKVGIKGHFISIFMVCLITSGICRAGGYFRLVLVDGTVVEGEMIRVTPATIEINPEGPEEFASYSQSVIKDIIYMKQNPESRPIEKPVAIDDGQHSGAGLLAVRFDIDDNMAGDETEGQIHDYVMIDSRLYFTGSFEDFMIELPSGNHTLELCHIKMAYYEPTDFYWLNGGGTRPRIWKQENPFTFGESMSIHVHRDSTTVITLDKHSRDYLFVRGRESRIIGRNDKMFDNQPAMRKLDGANGIIPGKLVFEELPKNYVFHDSLEYRYTYVFNESDWGRFNDAAYLPGEYIIEARALAWNRWKDRLIGETVKQCLLEIKSGLTTMIRFESYINRLDCQVTVLPESRFEISTLEAGE